MKDGIKKKYISPIHFEVMLKHHDKEAFKDLLDELIKEGNHHFEWDSKWEDKTLVYCLYIDSCHANNLKYFANQLRDGEV